MKQGREEKGQFFESINETLTLLFSNGPFSFTADEKVHINVSVVRVVCMYE